MARFGDYRSAALEWLPTAHDEGERRTVGRHPAPEVDWDHAYGDDGATLREEARALLAEGLTAASVARDDERARGLLERLRRLER
jgi:hypothetical protein